MAGVIGCPECGAVVLECDNSVYLDIPAAEFDGGHRQWTVMKLGGMTVASAGDPSADGMAHTLHDHQPAERE